MSRIGQQPVPLPPGTTARIGADGVLVEGPRGQMSSPLMPGITVALEGGVLTVERSDDAKQSRANHGLVRSLLANAVAGVSEGFKKELEIQGIGYRAAVKERGGGSGGGKLELQLGYSHPVIYPIPEGIAISVEKNTAITVEGIDKQKVGQVAAEIRAKRPPDAYKGKGVRYRGEVVRRKVGKAAIGMT